MDADGRAVIGPACRDTKFLCWSILLIQGNFTNLGGLAALVPGEARLFELSFA
jgi:hypothetical protein